MILFHVVLLHCLCGKFLKILANTTPYAASGWLSQYKMIQKNLERTETLAHGYSSDSNQQELSNEYQHDRV